MKIKLNLSAGTAEIEDKIAEALQKAKINRASLIEISYGTHIGETKQRIINVLMKKEYRKLYSRLVKSKTGWGRIFVHFRWK